MRQFKTVLSGAAQPSESFPKMHCWIFGCKECLCTILSYDQTFSEDFGRGEGYDFQAGQPTLTAVVTAGTTVKG